MVGFKYDFMCCLAIFGCLFLIVVIRVCFLCCLVIVVDCCLFSYLFGDCIEFD